MLGSRSLSHLPRRPRFSGKKVIYHNILCMPTFLFVTNNHSQSHHSPFTELTELLTSSIGKKHLHPDLPLQLRWMVVLNIMGTTGRRARAQQTRIIRKQLTWKQHWTIVKQERTIVKQDWTIVKQHWTIVKQHLTIIKAQRRPTCVFYSSGNQTDS